MITAGNLMKDTEIVGPLARLNVNLRKLRKGKIKIIAKGEIDHDQKGKPQIHLEIVYNHGVFYVIRVRCC